MSDGELYDITRGIWALGKKKEEVELVLAVANGIVRKVYIPDSWHPAGTTTYNHKHPDIGEKEKSRWEFIGKYLPVHNISKYIIAIPIIFFVSFTLIWEESKNRSLISSLIQETTMYILPVIPFLFLFSFLVKSGFNYYLALAIAIVGITVCTLLMKKFY